MSKKPTVQWMTAKDNPLVRLGVVLAALLLIGGLVWALNFIAHGAGANERKLMTALMGSLKEKNISGAAEVRQSLQGNAITVDANFGVKDLKYYDVNAKISGSLQGAPLDLPINIVGQDDAIYAKVINTNTFVESLVGSAETYREQLKPLANKIDNKWIRIAQTKNDTNECTAALFNKLSNDKKAMDEATAAYMGHQFLTVGGKKINSDGSTVLTVLPKYDKAEGFIQAIKSKDFFKQTKQCKDDYAPLGQTAPNPQTQNQPNTQNRAPAFAINVTINKNDRITKIESNETTITSKIEIVYDKPVTIKKPEGDMIDADELQQEAAPLIQAINTQQQQQQQQNMMMNPYAGMGVPQQ